MFEVKIPYTVLGDTTHCIVEVDPSGMGYDAEETAYFIRNLFEEFRTAAQSVESRKRKAHTHAVQPPRKRQRQVSTPETDNQANGMLRTLGAVEAPITVHMNYEDAIVNFSVKPSNKLASLVRSRWFKEHVDLKPERCVLMCNGRKLLADNTIKDNGLEEADVINVVDRD